ncbi:MAG: SDR family oxidoreductase [candidate division WOR-3 bacterium]|nr:MAG: SDR family oxidoreductase [candidate division WOR-3 bacterium]
MNVLVTGGAGFIGSHLVDHFVKAGAKTIVIDNLITGSEGNIAHHIDSGRITFLKEDVCNIDKISGEIDVITHLASPASPFDYLRYPIETMRTASLGTFNMLEIAKQKRAKFLLASTSEVYGDPEQHPQKEEYWGNVNPVGPRAVYDEGKRFAEALTTAYNREYDLETSIVRIFNTYGERMREEDGRVIPTFISQALKNEPLTIFGDGKQTRSFCYISDMVEGIIRAVQVGKPQPVNIGNPKEYTMLQVADIVRKLCLSTSGLKYLPLPENDPKKRRPDITRAKEVLGWTPKVDLNTGLIRIIEWFRRKDD